MMCQYEKFDFHIHSTGSDGIYNKEQIIQKAYEEKLKVISITDHNTYESIAKIQPIAQVYGIIIIPGIEFTVEWKETYFHLLAYFKDKDSKELNRLLQVYSIKKYKKLLNFMKRLKDAKIVITQDDIGIFGRLSFKNIARVLVQYGYVESFEDAMEQYVDNLEFFDNRVGFTMQDVIETIHNIGGIVSLAHPFYSFQGELNVLDMTERLVAEGIDGIECFNGKRPETEVDVLRKIAAKYQLIETGGSDFHEIKDQIGLGIRKSIELNGMNNFIRKVLL